MAAKARPNPRSIFDLSDKKLIAYLKSSSRPVGYLGPACRNQIDKLSSEDLGRQKDSLNKLWPSVITDALKHLKKLDEREWRRGSGIDFGSIFNEESLGIGKLEAVLNAFSGFESMWV